ncbi:MAG: ATP-binding protein [Pirellulales bacterium]
MTADSPVNPNDETARLLVQYGELAELAGALAHEIKNPLSVIRMQMDLLAEDFAQGETPRERRALQKIAMVSRQCTRLENLLRDFLHFARLRQLELRPASLNELLTRVLDFFAAQAREGGVEIVRYLDPNLPAVLLHPETLEAALVNLVKNALEAMPDGGQLMVRTRVSRTGVAVDMIDSGCGMDEKTLFKMFDAFYSTKTNGTGLGLPTAKKIIEAHGGIIDVQSAPGLGTKFTLEFPTPARLGTGAEMGGEEVADEPLEQGGHLAPSETSRMIPGYGRGKEC